MTTPAEETAELHNTLKPGAVQSYSQYILSRTRADLQELMKPLVLGDLTPDPIDPLVAEVANGSSITIRGPGNTMIAVTPGTAFVSNSTLDRVEVSPAGTAALITNGTNVVVQNAAAVAVAGSPGVATVSGGAVQNVKLTV